MNIQATSKKSLSMENAGLVYKAEIGVQPQQFDYIHFEVEGTPEEIRTAYFEMRGGVANFGKGIPDNEFRKLYDLVGKGQPIKGDPGIMDTMSSFQKFALNEVKKHYERTNK